VGPDPRNKNESNARRARGARSPRDHAATRRQSDKTLIELKFCDARCAHRSPRPFDSKNFVEQAATCTARADSSHLNIFAH